MTEDHDPDRLEHGTRDHDADRRFVDALLHHHFHGDEAASRRRVEAVLRQVDTASGAAVRAASVSPWWRALRPLAAAAAIASLILVPALLSNTASAAVERAIIAMSRPVDFHYRVEVEHPVGETGTVSGELWARGAELVVIRQDRVAGELWVGEGRDAAWMVPPLPHLPVMVGPKGRLLEVLTRGGDIGLPLLRISTLLARLGDSFELEFGPGRDTVEARRIAATTDDLPYQVSVRFASDGVVRELTARWDRVVGPRSVRLTWLDGDAKPASIYEHAAHHDAGREVVDLR